MDKLIEELEKTLCAMKGEWAKQQELEYRNKPHKTFVVGDWVTDGNLIGVVKWTNNDFLDYPESAGRMEVDLKNDNLSQVIVKRNEWELVSNHVFEYYAMPHIISFEVTGAQVYKLKKRLGPRNINPFSGKTKLLNALNESLDGWENE